MYRFDDLEIWNLAPGVRSLAGAQRIFNVVGRVYRPEEVRGLAYSLNGGPYAPVFIKRPGTGSKRLARVGDFNIDTIDAGDLRAHNRLRFRITRGDLPERRYALDFSVREIPAGGPRFELMFEGVANAPETGQVVDGKWRVATDDPEGPCLELPPGDAGYDRVILFGHRGWKTNYNILSKIMVTRWTAPRDFGVGLAFKWNAHPCGRGTSLPGRWSTGVGQYYVPRNLPRPGLGISTGVDVHYDDKGRYVGERMMRQGMLSPFRWVVGSLWSHVLRMNTPFSQLAPGRIYGMRMRVAAGEYALTVWNASDREPAPQVVARNPADRLPEGSVGIIAHRCGLKVYAFRVDPIP